MSGRLHIFMLPEHKEKLDAFVDLLGLTDEKYGLSHVVQKGLELLLERHANGELTEEQLAILKDVPDPVKYGHITVFLRQVNVNRAFKLINELSAQFHDYSLGHICTYGFLWLADLVESGSVDDFYMDQLKKVVIPKKVMYR